jgi:hypothetical protein
MLSLFFFSLLPSSSFQGAPTRCSFKLRHDSERHCHDWLLQFQVPKLKAARVSRAMAKKRVKKQNKKSMQR